MYAYKTNATPNAWVFFSYLLKIVCEFMSSMSFPCRLVSYNAGMSSRYRFSCDSKNINAPVLQSFPTFYVPKVKSDVWLTVHRNSVWIRKTNYMSLFVLFFLF